MLIILPHRPIQNQKTLCNCWWLFPMLKQPPTFFSIIVHFNRTFIIIPSFMNMLFKNSCDGKAEYHQTLHFLSLLDL